MCRWSMQDGSVMGDGGGQLKHGVVDTPVRVISRYDIGLDIGREGAAPDIQGGVQSPGRRQPETPHALLGGITGPNVMWGQWDQIS